MRELRPLIYILLVGIFLASCQISNQESTCPVTEPAWVKPPEDSAVSGTPEYGYYFVNEDRTILASAWWIDQGEVYLRAGEEGVKIGWFRPMGAELEITGQQKDNPEIQLRAEIPCCYPTRFQSTGLFFPTGGCWEINATAEDQTLTFTIWVDP